MTQRFYFCHATNTLEEDIKAELNNGSNTELKKGETIDLNNFDKVIFQDGTEIVIYKDMQPDMTNSNHFQALFYQLNFYINGKYVRIEQPKLNEDPIEKLMREKKES